MVGKSRKSMRRYMNTQRLFDLTERQMECKTKEYQDKAIRRLKTGECFLSDQYTVIATSRKP